MKTASTLTLTLTLAVLSLAAPAPKPAAKAVARATTSHVIIAKGLGLTGEKTTIEVSIDPATCSNLPSNFNNAIKSILPDAGIYCMLYDFPGCEIDESVPDSGRTWGIDHQIDDLSDPQYSYNFNDRATSIWCAPVSSGVKKE
ncbi:uncharacterized protein BDR25DRAFT_314981 [Lindgomyces ingoldianus]|uniref:Uncharacterized protein n=1 Tax=Lindgomyces ingoldianus TaxID=673940 RepID=A0ACB6QS69_9PLEO|nr:uncharacterized protein BDR25DRAFT_314981 [Lindgomyces ingoldianus]KAF2469725.1 hypothetical protein BDR25DRAFT_314981 [Lindgomyces ingoldianus]